MSLYYNESGASVAAGKLEEIKGRKMSMEEEKEESELEKWNRGR